MAALQSMNLLEVMYPLYVILRRDSTNCALLPLEDRPGLISLLAGKPNADTFPITSMQFTLRDPVSNEEVPVSLTESELARSLQYSGSKGIPDFLDWLLGLQEYSHGRKRGEGWDLVFGTGSSDLIYKVSARP